MPCLGGPERDEHGRECVRALSWAQVDEIVRRFEALNPYDREAVPRSILEIEKVNYDSAGNRRQLWTFPISAKRYPLYTLTQGRPALARVIDLDDREDADIPDEPAQLDELADAKQHGLGHLLNPLDPATMSRAAGSTKPAGYGTTSSAPTRSASKPTSPTGSTGPRSAGSMSPHPCWRARSSPSTAASLTGGRSARSTSFLPRIPARSTAAS